MTAGINLMQTTPIANQKKSNLSIAKILPAVGLGLIILLGAFLRFYELGTYTIGNTYYAAAVKSMLTSWHNFFFVAFEPGGSVTVDKPPLGFWVQAISAYFLGVNGFALALPQALAGVFSIGVLYHLVRRHFGVLAGLTAALVLAVAPVTIATERNNTIDGLLVFVLLLAAWAFIIATERGQLRYLLLGTFLVGLGFNIKMLQAYMVLPAFYALYIFGARTVWWKRILHLIPATILLLVVSLAWVITVDLIPAENRPYIGSSDNNTVLELIIGHNGLSRLGLNERGPWSRNATQGPRTDGANQPPRDGTTSQPGRGVAPSQANLPPGANPVTGANPPRDVHPPQEAIDACISLAEGDSCTVNLPNKDIKGTCLTISQGELVCVPLTPNPLTSNSLTSSNPQPLRPPSPPNAPDGGQRPGQAPGSGRSGETGSAGVLRLFEEPLVTEAGWLLPLVLLGIPLSLIASQKGICSDDSSWPVGSDGLSRPMSMLLWAGWLLPVMAYFSFTTGLFHRYYLIMLGPAIAALVGIIMWAVIQLWKRNHWMGWAVTLFITGITIIFEIYTFRSYPEYAGWVIAISVLSWLAGAGLLVWRSARPLQYVGVTLVLAALLTAPFTWSALTTFNTNPNVALPTAGTGDADHTRSTFMTPDESLLGPTGEAILEFVLANTEPDSYLLATLNARGAAPYILETDRSVLTFGGFTGRDNVVGVDDLVEMIENGELRYILGIPQQKAEIVQWMRQACTVVDVPGVESAQPSQQPAPDNVPDGPQGQNEMLFDCGG